MNLLICIKTQKNMKNFILTLIIGLFVITSNAQINSTQDGNWTNPATWGGMTIPTPGTDVIINHDVILNLDYGYTSGGITINANGSLKEDGTLRTLAMNGGYLVNNGTMTINNIALYLGKITNNDSMQINQYFYVMDSLINTGRIENMDSTYTKAYVDFSATSYFDSEAIWTDSLLYNDGIIHSVNFLNTDYFLNNGKIYATNHASTGTILNNGEIYVNDISNAGDFWNDGQIYASHSFSNFEVFNNNANAWLEMDADFLNADSIGLRAAFTNNGTVVTGNNWGNNDTIYGTTGEFYVQNISSNLGYMDGTFDFCDATPPGTSPYIDLNLGHFGSGITFNCIHQSVEQEETVLLSIYPNPAQDVITLSGTNTTAEISIMNIAGQKVLSINISGENTQENINIESLTSGMYILQHKTATETQTLKFIK
jgi:Secretion system C-terminal sorting domain